MPMQKGDVTETWADASLLQKLTNYKPKTNYKDGINNFVKWYLDYYNEQIRNKIAIIGFRYVFL
jgi:UDP-glucuronate 4-epimerase